MSSRERRNPDFLDFTESLLSETCPSCGEFKYSGHWLCIPCAAARNPFTAWFLEQSMKVFEFVAEINIRAARINRIRLEEESKKRSSEED